MENRHREEMIGMIYKALGDGLAKIIRHGIAFAVMTLAIAGLVWALIYVDNRHASTIAEMRTDINSMKNEWAEERNALRLDITACNIERQKQAIELAELRYIVKSLKR